MKDFAGQHNNTEDDHYIGITIKMLKHNRYLIDWHLPQYLIHGEEWVCVNTGVAGQHLACVIRAALKHQPIYLKPGIFFYLQPMVF